MTQIAPFTAKSYLQVRQLNKQALHYISASDLPHAYQSLSKAQQLIESALALTSGPISTSTSPSTLPSPQLKLLQYAGVTYNNLACYYREVHKSQIALIYLTKALNMESARINDSIVIATTRLNICVVLSQLHRHHKALKEAEIVVELLARIDGKKYFGRADRREKPYWNTVAAAYYNRAVEQEFLRDYRKAQGSYRKCREIMGEREIGNEELMGSCQQGVERMGVKLKGENKNTNTNKNTNKNKNSIRIKSQQGKSKGEMKINWNRRIGKKHSVSEMEEHRPKPQFHVQTRRDSQAREGSLQRRSVTASNKHFVIKTGRPCLQFNG